MTIDVEDYFHVSAFESVCPPDAWDRHSCRVEANTRRVLRILEETGVKATFFILGWVAERFPSLVKEIARAGHEVASHGFWHRRVYTQTREEFREDVRRSKALLEDVTGEAVAGYRAPSYSISRSTLWAFDELQEAGYAYDSSVFPIRHDLYGLADWPRFPFRVERLEGGNWVPAEAEPPRLDQPPPSLWEVPITTLQLLGRNVPIAGGGYFRLFPYPLTRWGLKRINQVDEKPFVFYVHPWELDPEQPRMQGAGLKSRFRHYVNLARTEERFRSLLSDFRFASLAESLCLLNRGVPPVGCCSPGP